KTDELFGSLERVLSDLHDPGEPGTWPGAGPQPTRLVDRLLEVRGLLGADADEAFDTLYNGAFVLESLPAALWCFLHSPEDLEEVVVTAANGGRDADTVAAMAGTLAGAYLGDRALPARWLDDLEDRVRITALADGLYAVAERRPRGTAAVPLS